MNQQHKLFRITTVPISLDKLIEGQMRFMSQYFDVSAISSDETYMQRIAEKEQVNVYTVNMTRQITPIQDLKSVVQLYKLFKKERPTIVHTHTPKAGLVGMMAGFFARVPVRLHTVAGLPLMEAKGLKRIVLNIVEKLTYAFAHKVYPNSKGLYDFILKERFTSGNKLKVLGNGSSNGIKTATFNPALFSTADQTKLREQLEITTDDFVFIFVGRLVKDKGINELIAAFEMLCKQHQQVKLLLVGPLETELSPLMPKTLQSITDNQNIIAVGYQQDVRPYFSISDALVFPSYREGFPNVVMQAGAMGLPSIVSDINGCNEIIEESKNGCIIPVKNQDAILTAMTTFLQEKEQFLEMKKNARKIIVSRYEQSVIWEALHEEYDSLITKL